MTGDQRFVVGQSMKLCPGCLEPLPLNDICGECGPVPVAPPSKFSWKVTDVDRQRGVVTLAAVEDG